MLLNLFVDGIHSSLCKSNGCIIHRDILQHDIGHLASGPLLCKVLCGRIELVKAFQHRGFGRIPIQLVIVQDGTDRLIECKAYIPDLIAHPAVFHLAVCLGKPDRVFLHILLSTYRLLRHTKHLRKARRKPLEESSALRAISSGTGFSSGIIFPFEELDKSVRVCALIYKVNIRDFQMLQFCCHVHPPFYQGEYNYSRELSPSAGIIIAVRLPRAQLLPQWRTWCTRRS